jgi:acetyltransferase EpsM
MGSTIDVLILGAGGHGRVVGDILLCAQQAGSSAVPIGYLDDDRDLYGSTRQGLPVLGSLAEIDRIAHHAIILAIGDNRTRKQLYEQLCQRGEHFVAAIHPRAVVASDVQVGVGTVICAHVTVNPGSVIGSNAILNTGCTVDHDNRIGDHVHIAPGAHLGGDIAVGTGALIGIGAVVMPQRHVQEWSIVGAGALVTKHIPAHTTWIGVPARPMEKR